MIFFCILVNALVKKFCIFLSTEIFFSDSAKKTFKTQIPPKKYLMNVWKPIDQVVLPPKKAYKYILHQKKGY